MNPIVKSLLKNYMPEIKKNIKSGEKGIIEHLRNIPLQEGETHAVIFTEVDENILYVIVGAFTGKTFSRAISITPAEEFLTNLLSKI